MRLILERVLNWIWYRPNLAKWFLWPLGGIYRLAIEIRRLLYQLGLKATTTLSIPVIVVGNITVGGTGKTPFIIWLATELQTRGYRVSIISRGYGGKAENWPQHVDSSSDPQLVGDEPVLLARATGCLVVVAPDRVAAGQALIAKEQIDVILSDDGLQHYPLNRQLEIVVIDGERGFGNGLSLPAGPLREPKSRLGDVDIVIVNDGSWEHKGAFRTKIVAQPVYQIIGSRQKSLEGFRNTTVHAIAGIAHPSRFFDLLEAAGINVIRHPLPDHAKLDAATLAFGDDLPVFVTEKDAVKCQSICHENVWCVPVKLELDAENGDRLIQSILTNTIKCGLGNPHL